MDLEMASGARADYGAVRKGSGAVGQALECDHPQMSDAEYFWFLRRRILALSFSSLGKFSDDPSS
jgi:hypothetical protein